MDETGDQTPSSSRYVDATRRAFLTKSLSVGAAAALSGLLAACGHDDAKAFATAPTAAPTTSVPATTSPTTSAAPTTTEPATTTAPPASGDAVASGTKATVTFTYTASSGGRANNPYIAVWVEDADGALVSTIALWFLQSQKGQRWLNELVNWYSLDGAVASGDTASGASRPAGEYAVTWDGTDLEGALVPTGDYFVCIEAAREHGPHSLIRGAVSMGRESLTVALTDDEELSDANVAVVVP